MRSASLFGNTEGICIVPWALGPEDIHVYDRPILAIRAGTPVAELGEALLSTVRAAERRVRSSGGNGPDRLLKLVGVNSWRQLVKRVRHLSIWPAKVGFEIRRSEGQGSSFVGLKGPHEVVESSVAPEHLGAVILDMLELADAWKTCAGPKPSGSASKPSRSRKRPTRSR